MSSESSTQLHGYRLILVRAAWVAITTSALVLWVLDIPPSYAQNLTVCTLTVCPNQLPTPSLVQSLNSAGLSLQFYAFYLTALSVVFVLIFCFIGVVIAWRKSDDWMALLVSITLIILGTNISTDYQQLASMYPITQVPGNLLHFLFTILPFLIVFLFPNGRFVPRWTGWIALTVVLYAVGSFFLPSSPLNTQNLPNVINIVLVLLLFVTVIFAQIYRYIRVSTPIERQQTKWVLLGIAATFIYFIVLDIFGTLNPGITQARSLGFLAPEASYFLAVLIVPLSIAFSILRYRLWDIDLLIKRTLVYTILTVILALVYFGSVVLLQHLVNAVTGQIGQSPVVIVASTLMIAALFSPLRRRIQKIIDKRFYRRQYDAAKIVSMFSDTLRNEMDLDTLQEHLLSVVQETMQPAHVSLWLRKQEPGRKGNTNDL